MSFLVYLKTLVPGYRNKWKKNTKAMIEELNKLNSEVSFNIFEERPEILINKKNLKFTGFKTDSDFLDIFYILKPWLPRDLNPECFRLALDIVSRYKYPHMRPDLFLQGFDTDELFGFHGQHKDNISSIKDVKLKHKFSEAFKPKTNDIIIDCGAYIGLGDISLSNKLSEGKIIAVEASRECYDLLVHNLNSNNIKNVIPLHNAVWENKCRINLNTGNAQANSLIKDLTEWKSHETVNAVPIDDIVSKFGLKNVSMISLTLNGAEVEAINGAHQTIKKYRPRIRLAGWYYRENKRIADILKPILENEFNYLVFVGPRGNLMALPE